MDNNNQNDGKFFSGFLLGLLVGGFVVFLLGTKKGKKLLKAISEDGIENFSNLLDEANKSEDLDEVKPPFAKAPHFAEASRGKPEGRRKELVQKREFAFEEKPKVRRFFRGTSRRVN